MGQDRGDQEQKGNERSGCWGGGGVMTGLGEQDNREYNKTNKRGTTEKDRG